MQNIHDRPRENEALIMQSDANVNKKKAIIELLETIKYQYSIKDIGFNDLLEIEKQVRYLQKEINSAKKRHVL